MKKTIQQGPSDVLLVIDVQNGFCAGGALAVPGGDEIVPLINRIAKRFEHVVLTQDWHPEGHRSFASAHPGRKPFDTIELPYGPQVLWPDHCIQGSKSAEFHPDLDIPHAELMLRKGFHPDIDSYSAFFENDRTTPTGLGGYLRERGFTRVFLAGARARLLRALLGGGRPEERFQRHDFGRRLPRHRYGRVARCGAAQLRGVGNCLRPKRWHRHRGRPPIPRA